MQQFNDDLAAPGKAHDVPRDLRDGGGHQGQLDAGESCSCGDLACSLPGSDDVRVGCDRNVHLVVPDRAATQERSAEAGAHVALEQMACRIELLLASPVGTRQRQQHRSAPVSRRRDVLQRQQVLDPQTGAGAFELGRDGPSRRIRLLGERPGVLTCHLVG